VRRITCSDFLPLAIACKHVIEGETDDELLHRLREHASEEHPQAEFDEEDVRALIARPV
jgi:predicted small metal-binding protein